jgi:predicted nucleic acid-binding protein
VAHGNQRKEEDRGKGIEQDMEQNADFTDGYMIAGMDRYNVTEIFSYDKKQ